MPARIRRRAGSTRPSRVAAHRSRYTVEELEKRIALATLDLNDDIHRVATLPSTTATLTGTSELHVTGTGDPISGSVIHLNSADAWLFLDNIRPSTVTSSFLGRVRVNNAPAVLNSNVRVVQYGQSGAVVIPHAPSYAPLQVFSGPSFTGSSLSLTNFTEYNDTNLGALASNISSFKLERGYTATIAQYSNGTGVSKNYVAQDGDIEVDVLPSELDNTVSFVRVFPWRWVTKKGAGNLTSGLNLGWYYNWNIDQNSTLDLEYVPIRQHTDRPTLEQDWRARGSRGAFHYCRLTRRLP
jgi:hypothetical protein